MAFVHAEPASSTAGVVGSPSAQTQPSPVRVAGLAVVCTGTVSARLTAVTPSSPVLA